jgi:alkaline phosphatase
VTVVVLLVMAAAVPSVEGAEEQGNVKNIIMLVPDGCTQAVATAARWYTGEDLALDRYARGMMKTYMSNSVITGSAAAATAFATGNKTTVRFLGIGPRPEDVLSTEPLPPEEVQYAPFASVLEGAKLLNKATGLISTSRITHATPAAFAVHIQDRGWDNEIMEHIVYNDVDVVFGGGERHLLPEDAGGRRTDGENLKDELIDRGYQYVTTRDGMMTLSSGRVWGMFASSHMEAEIDRAEYAPDQPSLAEMTEKAIELLSQDDDGFFLMVEGSQVDWAGHNNDPIYMITDFVAFDEAFEVAVDWARQHGDTLVIAFPDHDTGGMTIGHYYTEYGYTETPVEYVIGPLQGMQITSYGVERKIDELGGPTVANTIDAIDEWWGIEITEDDAQAIFDYQEATGVSLSYAIAVVISQRFTVFGWTTHGHTGTDVPIWSYGPYSALGTLDNTQVAKRAARAFGFNLDSMKTVLFQNLGDHYPNFTMDTSDPENPVVKVGNVSLPVSKDYMMVNGLKTALQLPGLTVHAPATDKVYVSLVAIALIDAFNSGKSYDVSSRESVEQRLRELAAEAGVDPELAVSTLD